MAGLWVAWCFTTLCAASASAGTITATLKAEEPITRVWALRREETQTGVASRPTEGKVLGGRLTVAELPPGRYDLRFETPSGVVEGWDASVPASDYEEEQPLDDAARKTLVEKMSRGFAIEFHDRAQILDIRGNIQHAAVLLGGLRTRPFAEGTGTTAGIWVLRVDRWQWENPEERTWVPKQETPYHALLRERLKPEEYARRHVVYARHLGGIAVTADKPDVDLGTIVVPKPPAEPGVAAANPDGSPTTPIVLKPKGAASASAATPTPATTRPTPSAVSAPATRPTQDPSR